MRTVFFLHSSLMGKDTIKLICLHNFSIMIIDVGFCYFVCFECCFMRGNPSAVMVRSLRSVSGCVCTASWASFSGWLVGACQFNRTEKKPGGTPTHLLLFLLLVSLCSQVYSEFRVYFMKQAATPIPQRCMKERWLSEASLYFYCKAQFGWHHFISQAFSHSAAF